MEQVARYILRLNRKYVRYLFSGVEHLLYSKRRKAARSPGYRGDLYCKPPSEPTLSQQSKTICSSSRGCER